MTRPFGSRRRARQDDCAGRTDSQAASRTGSEGGDLVEAADPTHPEQPEHDDGGNDDSHDEHRGLLPTTGSKNRLSATRPGCSAFRVHPLHNTSKWILVLAIMS